MCSAGVRRSSARAGAGRGASTGWRPLHSADGNVRSGRGCRSGGPRSGRFLRLVALGAHFLVKNAVISFSQVTPADLRSLRCDPCSQPWRTRRPLGGCSWWQRSACSVLVYGRRHMARLVPRPCSVSLDQPTSCTAPPVSACPERARAARRRRPRRAAAPLEKFGPPKGGPGSDFHDEGGRWSPPRQKPKV